MNTLKGRPALSKSSVLLSLCAGLLAAGCSVSQPQDVMAAPSDTMPTLGKTRQASSGLTRTLYILDEAGTACSGTVQGFFQCMLGSTNWNDLANGYSAGETIKFGKLVTTSGVPCSNVDFQCAANVGAFPVTDWDIILIIYPSGGVGGQNGTASVNGHTINSAYIWSNNNNCNMQTVYGGHEVFEAQTDGISADCCDGEVPGNAGSSCLNWCNNCGAVCAKYGSSSCSYGGYTGNNSYGIATISCGGHSYQYQTVSPANAEFNGTCVSIVVKGAALCTGGPGWYCGGDGITGNSSHLYYCPKGSTGSTTAIDLGGCGNGVCVRAPVGTADYCQGGFSNSTSLSYPGYGWWCGGAGTPYNHGTSGHLYFFDDNLDTDMGACARGCQVASSGNPDYCK